jgi:hypothetical protein
MGLLNLFSKSSPGVQMLPSGSLTIDRHARILASTVPSAIPASALEDMGAQVLTLFREARNAQLPLTELKLQFAGLQITAREQRGGAMIFLTPKHSSNMSPEKKM